jgi:Protein of unknown function (DUF3054)
LLSHHHPSQLKRLDKLSDEELAGVGFVDRGDISDDFGWGHDLCLPGQEGAAGELTLHSEQSGQTQSVCLEMRRRVAVLVAGDTLALLLFAVLGRANHGENISVADVFGTALPFLLGAPTSTFDLVRWIPVCSDTCHC